MILIPSSQKDQQILLFLRSGRKEQEVIEDHQGNLPEAVHSLIVNPLQPGCFHGAEEFREPEISGGVLVPAGIGSQRTGDVGLPAARRADQHDVQPFSDVVIRLQGRE